MTITERINPCACPHAARERLRRMAAETGRPQGAILDELVANA